MEFHYHHLHHYWSNRINAEVAISLWVVSEKREGWGTINEISNYPRALTYKYHVMI